MQNICFRSTNGAGGQTAGGDSVAERWVAVVDEQNLRAYDLLAPEYDSPEHATTRRLERLSTLFCSRVIEIPHIRNFAGAVLEIGCGTGVISEMLWKTYDVRSTIIMDCSSAMLRMATSRATRLGLERSAIRHVQDSILRPVRHWKLKFDLVVASLADPYFLPPAVLNLRKLCTCGSTLIVTLPEKSWAIAERQTRLHVPVSMTRFRLKSGLELEPYSFTYGLDEIRDMLARFGYRVTLAWVEQENGEPASSENLPSILGLVAKAQ